MMTRGHVTELLSAYLDEQVAPAERERIEAHLRACAACRRHLESLRQAVALVRGVDPVPAPAGFQAAVRARLSAAPLPRPGLRPLWWVVAVAAAAVVVGIFSANFFMAMRSGIVGIAPERAREVAAPQRTVAPAPAAPDVAQRSTGAPSLPALPALRQIIRSARVQLVVDDVDAAARRLMQIAEGAGGFVAASSTSLADRTPQGVFTLRVPAAQFSAVLLEVERLGTVQSRRVSGQDVTEEFVDLQARLRNLERHESRLLSFMDRATRVGDLLAIERELARVRGEIEVLTGRLRFLEHQVALATVEVALRQKAPVVGGRLWDAGATLQRMTAAFRATLRQLAGALEAAAVLAAALLPVGVLGAAVVLIARRWRRA